MSERFRRGSNSIGPGQCSGCGKALQHGDIYLAIDEKPSDKVKDEIIYDEDIKCSKCTNSLKSGDEYLLVLDELHEKIYCPSCLKGEDEQLKKKKSKDTFREKTCGAEVKYKKSSEESQLLTFCQECSEKCGAGHWRKEKGEKVFSFFMIKGTK